MVVEFDLHPHRSMRFDPMHLLRFNQTRTVRGEKQPLLSFAPHEIMQGSVKNPDHAPNACFGIVRSAKRFRECRLVEDGRHFVRPIAHDSPSTKSLRYARDGMGVACILKAPVKYSRPRTGGEEA